MLQFLTKGLKTTNKHKVKFKMRQFIFKLNLILFVKTILKNI